MDKYVDLDVPDFVVGIQALRHIKAEGPKRQQLGVLLEGDTPITPGFRWHAIQRDGQTVGSLTNSVWSYRLKRNIGFGLVSIDCAVNDRVEVLKDGQAVKGTLALLPFI